MTIMPRPVVVLACLAGTWLLGGCAMTNEYGSAFASLTGDSDIAAETDLDHAGFLGSGAVGATGEAQFADGRAATVALGPKYFSAGGRWCRRFQIIAPGTGAEAAPEEQTACRDRAGWQRTKSLVVTRIPGAQHGQ